MQDKVADYEKLLKDLAVRASDPDAELIRLTLERVSQVRLLNHFRILIMLGFSARNRRDRHRLLGRKQPRA